MATNMFYICVILVAFASCSNAARLLKVAAPANVTSFWCNPVPTVVNGLAFDTYTNYLTSGWIKPYWNTANNITGSGGFDAVYQTECASSNMTFTVPVATTGCYKVTVYDAEIYWTWSNFTGQRVFNVSIQGKVVASNVDLYAQFGPLVADPIVTYVSVTNVVTPSVVANFVAIKDLAKLGGMSVQLVTPSYCQVKGNDNGKGNGNGNDNGNDNGKDNGNDKDGKGDNGNDKDKGKGNDNH